jgi:hypothetical protein
MLKRVMIGLCAISVVAILWTEASAGCRRLPQPNGTVLCSANIPGSVTNILGTVTTQNLNSPEIDVDWQNKFELFGRETEGFPDCDPGSLDPDCGLKGKLICRKGGAKKTIDHTISQAADGITLPLRATKDIKCVLVKNGECLVTLTAIKVDVTSCTSCTPKCVATFGPGWAFHEFIPTKFNAVAASCSQDYETSSCPGQEIFIAESVNLVGGVYQAAQLNDEVYREDCDEGICPPPDEYCPYEECTF